METVSSLSGGKTSSYMAVKYPTDHNVFALIRTENKDCMFPDAKVRQIVSDNINAEFIGTLEDDTIVYTMLDLEQFTGRKINWVTGETFEKQIERKGGYLPNNRTRFCTVEMKIKPIANWCYQNTELPIEMNIGFRANEQQRADKMKQRLIGSVEPFKFVVDRKNNRNKWETLPYRTLNFPLMNDGVYKDNVIEYWRKHSQVRFAKFNNCVGCFHQNPILLYHRSNENPVKYEWFANTERQSEKNKRFIDGTSYDKIASFKTQFELFDTDFSDCDSGYCGI
jgi:hypothetical protein